MELPTIIFRAKMPIFVARQLVRHRTISLQEQSARYSILTDDFYIPSDDVIRAQSKMNKQGRDLEVTEARRREYLDDLEYISTESYNSYLTAMNLKRVENGELIDLNPDDTGIARELARMMLPLNTYTLWVYEIDVHNLMHLLSLRMDPHAQWETRQYANIMGSILQTWMPNVWQAFEDYRLQAATLSRMEVAALRELLTRVMSDGGLTDNEVACTLDKHGASKREVTEFITRFFNPASEPTLF